MLTTALVTLLLPALAAAQYGPPDTTTGTNTPTSSATAPAPSAPADTPGNMNIDVAPDGAFSFKPNNIKAPNGTLVTFWIPDQGFDHSITQSSFAAPCTYLDSSANSTSAGFDSGLQSKMKFTIKVTDDTKPIWFHCKQVLHCGMGMVGSINAPDTDNTFDSFLAAAKQIGGAEVQETDKGFVAGGINAVATGPPVSSTGDDSTAGNPTGGGTAGNGTTGSNTAGSNAAGSSTSTSGGSVSTPASGATGNTTTPASSGAIQLATSAGLALVAGVFSLVLV